MVDQCMADMGVGVPASRACVRDAGHSMPHRNRAGSSWWFDERPRPAVMYVLDGHLIFGVPA